MENKKNDGNDRSKNDDWMKMVGRFHFVSRRIVAHHRTHLKLNLGIKMAVFQIF